MLALTIRTLASLGITEGTELAMTCSDSAVLPTPVPSLAEETNKVAGREGGSWDPEGWVCNAISATHSLL